MCLNQNINHFKGFIHIIFLLTKCFRAVSSEILENASVNSTRAKFDALCGGTLQREPHDGHLKPLNGGSRSENSLQRGDKSLPLRLPISCPPGAIMPANSGDEPSPLFLNSSKSVVESYLPDCSVTVCPFCHRQFGLEESISEIKSHIEMHVFAGDASLT